MKNAPQKEKAFPRQVTRWTCEQRNEYRYNILHTSGQSACYVFCVGVEGIVYFRWTLQVFRGVVQKSFQSINFEKTIAPHLWSHGKISWNLQNVYNLVKLLISTSPFTVEERFVVGWLVCLLENSDCVIPWFFKKSGMARLDSIAVIRTKLC